MEAAMKEKQVNKKLFLSDHYPVLVSHKSKILSESEDKVLDIVDYLLFKNTLVKRIGVFDVYEIKKIFVLK